jgi:hypothetical protein
MSIIMVMGSTQRGFIHVVLLTHRVVLLLGERLGVKVELNHFVARPAARVGDLIQDRGKM